MRLGFEYWNAGVESYNTFQEVEYFSRYHKALRPELTILFFHLNDFLLLPSIVRDSEGRALAYAPYSPSRPFSVWWYQNSVIYRLLLFARLAWRMPESRSIVRDSIVKLKSVVEGFHGELLVVVLPIFDRFESWNEGERRAHQDKPCASDF